MRNPKLLIGFITILLLAVVLLCALWDPFPEQEPQLEGHFFLSLSTENGIEQINYVPVHAWDNAISKFVMVLPGYADCSDALFQLTSQTPLFLDGVRLTDGMPVSQWELERDYTLTIETQEGPQEFSFQFLRSGGIPTMHIDTLSGSMDYIHAEKGNQESGHIRTYSPQGKLTHSGRLEKINGRGNTTWEQAKKPYSITLAQDADLLGLGEGRRWVLLANALDETHLRNQIAFDLADQLGLAFSPDSQWVDLYLNGDYAGLYLLCERNEIHPQRIAISDSGSMLVSREMEERLINGHYDYISTNSNAALRIHDPDYYDEEMVYLWQSVDNAIFAKDGIDPVTGKSWEELIDLDSWAKEYLLSEVLGNLDAGAISQFFYIDGADPSRKVYAGPVWDYDFAMGNSHVWQLQTANAFVANRPYIWSEQYVPWCYALYQKPEFFQYTVELYETRLRPLIQELLDENFSRYTQPLEIAIAVNEIRWNLNHSQDETTKLGNYMAMRLALLDDIWLQNAPYYTVVANYGKNLNAACYLVRPGDCLTALPMEDSEAGPLTWYHVDSGEVFDITQPIYEDTHICLKWGLTARGTSRMSMLNFVPIGAMAGIMLAMFAADHLRFRERKSRHPQKEPASN